MKAKEYLQKFSEATDRDVCLVEIGRMFIGEINELAKMRNAKFDRALIPIVEELNQKWLKFALLVNNKFYQVTPLVKYEGFIELLKHFSPELFKLWANSSTQKH